MVKSRYRDLVQAPMSKINGFFPIRLLMEAGSDIKVNVLMSILDI